MDRIVARRALLAAAIVGIGAQAVLVHAPLGLNIPILVAATLIAGIILAGGVRRIDPLDAWLPIAAVVIAAPIALRSDPTLAFLDAVTAASLLGASMAALAGAAVTRRTIMAIIALGTVVLAWMIGGALRVTVAARRAPNASGWRSRLPQGSVPVLRGLAIALPVLAVFVALFSAADAIFATLAGGLFDWRLDLDDLTLRGAIAFGVAWLVAGLLAVAAGDAGVQPGEPTPRMQSLGAAAVEPVPLLPRLGVTEAVTVLVAVDLLFVAFVALQVAYLFGGLDTIAAGGITYANYARRGFFELVAVTMLAGGLIVGLLAVVSDRTRAFVAAAVSLSALNLVVLTAAALRLRVYQEAYGWTELRFYIYATIGWLAVCIVAAIILLVRDRMRWLPHAMTIAAVVVLAAANVVGPQRLVADENVARLLNPALVPVDGRAGLDLEYAMSLGDDAVPALVAALPALTRTERGGLLEELRSRWDDLREGDATAWPGWNLARERARAALATVFDR
jgi:hypothetical protein